MNMKRRRCPNQNYKHGRWVSVFRNDFDQEENNDDNSTSFHYYDWQVSNNDEHPCELEKVSSIQEFCAVLDGRSILFVGDSMNMYWFQYFVSSLGKNFTNDMNQNDTHYGKLRRLVSTTINICDEIPKKQQHQRQQLIGFTRNDHLDMNLLHSRKPFAIPWIPISYQYDILVLNFGAHAVPLEEYQKKLDLLRPSLQSYMNNTGRMVLFRTTPRGHVNCSNEDKPIQQVNDSYWQRFYPTTFYDWDRFPHYNRMIHDTFGSLVRNTDDSTNHNQHNKKNKKGTKTKSLNDPFHIMDIASITELRPDGHLKPKPGADCLHYKIPPPQRRNNTDTFFKKPTGNIHELWTQLFFNFLVGNL